MAYLDQGLTNAYSFVIENSSGDKRFKIVMSPDGTVVTSEKTSLGPGVYPANSEVQEMDKNIINAISSIYKKSLKWDTGTNVQSMILNLLEAAHSASFWPIRYIPKMTKALATNLSSIKEAMVFYENEKDQTYDFLCFGYRRIIAESLHSKFGQNDIYTSYIFPDRFFTGASFETRFKANNLYMTAFTGPDLSLITNDADNKDRISIVMGLNWQEHTNYIDRTLIED